MTENILMTIVLFLDLILPVFNLSTEFISKLDSAISMMIGFIQGASYFLPLDVFVICLSTMILIDNFTLITRLLKWVVGLVRG